VAAPVLPGSEEGRPGNELRKLPAHAVLQSARIGRGYRRRSRARCAAVTQRRRRRSTAAHAYLTLLTETEADPDRFFVDQVPAELIQVVHIVRIELRPDEDMLGDVDLHARPADHLEMIRASEELAEALAARERGVGSAALVKLDIRASDAAIQLERRALALHRLQNALEVVERRARLDGQARKPRARGRQRDVVTFGRLEGHVRAHAETLPQHQVARKTHHEGAEAGGLRAA